MLTVTVKLILIVMPVGEVLEAKNKKLCSALTFQFHWISYGDPCFVLEIIQMFLAGFIKSETPARV